MHTLNWKGEFNQRQPTTTPTPTTTTKHNQRQPTTTTTNGQQRTTTKHNQRQPTTTTTNGQQLTTANRCKTNKTQERPNKYQAARPPPKLSTATIGNLSEIYRTLFGNLSNTIRPTPEIWILSPIGVVSVFVHICAMAMSCAHVFNALPNALACLNQPGVPLERPGSTGADGLTPQLARNSCVWCQNFMRDAEQQLAAIACNT